MREKNMCSPSSHALVLASAKASATGPNVVPPELFKIHKGYEWAHIFIDEITGTFSAVSSFGNFAHIWTHRGGETLKEFMAGLNYDYFMGKTAHSKGRVFSPEKTTEGLKQIILENRRGNFLDKELAREAWEDLSYFEDERVAHEYFDGLTGSDALMKVLGGDYYDVGRDADDPQCRGFWDKIWPEFVAALRVSGRHSQSEDTNVAEGEACQSGPERVTPVNPSLQEGALEDLIKKLDAFADRKRGPVGRAMQIEPRFSCGDLTFGDILDTVAVLRSLSTDLAKAKEGRDEARTTCEALRFGMKVEKERADGLYARVEALQAENEKLKAERDDAQEALMRVAEIIGKDSATALLYMDVQSRLATLTKRYERGLEPFVAFFEEAMKGFTEGYSDRTSPDRPVVGWNGANLLMRHFTDARALLNTKGESDV